MTAVTTEKVLKSSDGTDIFARATGNPDGPSLVFIHGLALSGNVFDDLFKDAGLLQTFYLVSYDMRGHGRSGKPNTLEGHASKLYADDFSLVVEAFNLKSPILIGWSLGATVACDVCSHLPAGFISGIVYAGGLPYIGPIMEDVGTPFIIGLLPGLFTTTDVALFINTKHEFIASLFNEPDNVPVDMKWSWLGSTMMQNPDVCKAVLTRVQDPQKFLEAAADGLPLLVVNGTRDTHSKGEVLVKKLEPLFKDLEVCTIQGGSHSMFYDNKVEFIQAVTSFANRVARKS